MLETLTESRPEQAPQAPTEPPTEPRSRTERLRAYRRHWLPALVTACCAAVVLLWVRAGVRSAGHGLNFADESFYLISYRWWDTHYRNFTGVQYIYGPVFELLGRDIAGLRLFRLLTVVVVHAVLGWSFMRWLRTYRPAAPPTRLWEAAGASAIVAAGGVACGWLPLTPGYNDAALLGSFLEMSFVLFMARRVDLGRPIPLRLPIGYGAVVPLLLLAKWGALAAVLLTAAAGALVLGRRPIREIARILGGVAAGAAIVVALLELFVPVTTAVAELVRTNQSIMALSGVSTTAMFRRYGLECWEMTYSVVDRYPLLLLAAAVAVVVGWLPQIRFAAGALAVTALGLSAWKAVATSGVHGGAGYSTAYTRVLLLVLLVTLWIGLLVVDGERVHRALRFSAAQPADPPPAGSSLGAAPLRSRLLLGAVLLLPVVQALGTTGTLMPRAIGGFAAWMAVMVAVFTGIEAASVPARALTAGILAASVLAAGSIAVGGLWRTPYRTFPYWRSDATAVGVPALASLRLYPATAKAFAEMRRQLRPYVEPEGRAMQGVPAAVFALDGRPVGEVWPRPTGVAEGIRDACRSGHPWWGSRPPILLYPTPVGQLEIDAFRACGIDFHTDYRPLAVYKIPTERKKTTVIQVYVPAAEFIQVPGYPPQPERASAGQALAGRAPVARALAGQASAARASVGKAPAPRTSVGNAPAAGASAGRPAR